MKIERFPTHLVLVAVWLLVCTGSAMGQTDSGDDDPRTTARINAGPVHLTPTFEITNLGVDTNVFNSQSDPKSDFTMTVNPGVNSAILFGHMLALTTRVVGEGTYYRTMASQRSIGGQVNQRVELRFERLSLFADGAFTTTRNRPSLEIDERVRHENLEYGAGFLVKLSQRLGFGAGAQREQTQFDPNAIYDFTSLRETLNHETASVNGKIQFAITPYTTVSLGSDVSRDQFPFSPVRNHQSYRILPGVTFSPRAAITGSAEVGMRNVEPGDPALPPFRGLVSHLSLGYHVHDTMLVTVMADRDVESSFESKSPYYLDTTLGLSIRRHILGRFDATAAGQTIRYDYRNFITTSTGELLSTRRDNGLQVSLSLGTRLTGGMRLETGATYLQRTSTTEQGRDYSGWRLMTSFVRGL